MYYKITIETITEPLETEQTKYPKSEKIYEQVLPEMDIKKIIKAVNNLQETN